MATLKLRRGSSFTSPQLGEPFYNTNSDTLQLGIGTGVNDFVTFTKLDDINTGSLLLSGDISADGDITASNLRVENDIRIQGNIFLGDTLANDNINIQASFSGSLIPEVGSEFDLGSETETWRNLYVDTANIGQIELDGITVLENLTVSGTSSLQTVTELNNGTLEQYSQSVESRLSQLETDSGSQEGRLDNLELFTSSQETKNTTLENTTSSLEQATSSLEIFTSSQEDFNATLATTGSNTFIGNQFITGSIVVSGSGHSFIGNADISGSLLVSGAINFQIPDGFSADVVNNSTGSLRLVPGYLQSFDTLGDPTTSTFAGGFYRFDSIFLQNKDGNGYNEIGISANVSRSLGVFDTIGDIDEQPGFYASSGSDSFTYYTWLRLQNATEYTDGRVTFTTPIISSGSLTAPLQEGYYWVGDENGYNEQVPTSSFTDRIDTLESGNTSQGARLDNLEIFTSSQETKNTTLESVTSSLENRTTSLESFTGSQEVKNTTLATVTASLEQRLDSFESVSASYARTDLENTFTGTQSFDNIVVNGTGSFGQLTSVTGTAKIIGDAFIILNNDTPTQRYAGIKVLDSGSSDTTASFQFDGQTNDFFYQYTDDGGVTDEFGIALFGPEYNNIGTPIYPENNYILKGLGGHHVSSSRITDDGIKVEIETSLNVVGDITGSSFSGQILSTNGVISGSDQLTSSFDLRYLNTNSEGIVSGSSQVTISDTIGYTTFSSSLNTRFVSLEDFVNTTYNSDSSSFDSRIDNNESTGSNHENRLDTIETTFSSSLNSRITNLELTGSDHESRISDNFDDISNLETSESLLDGRVSELETFSSSLDTEFLNVGGDNVVSGSTGDQLTSSYDQRYAQSSSFQDVSSSYSTLVGDFSTDIELGIVNLGDAAFLNVSSSLTPSTPNEVLANAGAIREYISGTVGAADITAVIAEDGLSGGGTDGDVTMSLDTGSTHFTDGVLFSLPQGTISGSDQLDLLGYLNVNGDNVFTSSQQVEITDVSGFSTFSSSVDIRLDDLETFSSSLSTDFVTQVELTNATGALEDNISTKLDTSSYNTDSSSFDGRIDNLESFTSSIDTTIKTKLDTDGVVSGSSQISFTGITDKPTLVSGSSQVVYTDLSSIPSGIVSGSTQITDGSDLVSGSVLRPNGDGVVSGSTQISFTGITDKPTLVSGSSQVVYTDLSSIPSGIVSGSTQITDGSDLVSGSVLRPGGDGVISGSDQLTGSLVDLSSDQTISGTKTFNDIVVNGTGSFAVIESVSGDAKIIGDAYIILNNDTPTSRYAGFKVLDSGSAGTTASFEYDGQTNDFFYQYTDDGGVTDEFGIALFGPEYNTKGSPTYLSNNTIPKGDGGHHLNDSNITDSGTLITLGSNSVVEGTFYATGTTLVSGSSQISYSGLSNIPTDIVSSSTDSSTIDFTITNGTITGEVIGGVISGSSQVNADTITNFDSNVKTKLDLDGVHSGSDQVVQFSKVGIGTASDATYELKVDGDIGAMGDVVAYVSSDRRLKENITRISDPISKINQLSGYSFEWNEEKQNIYNGKDYGVVAQEVQEIFPELVTERESGYLGVKYDRLVSVLIEAVKELSNEVNELKSKLE